MAGNLDSAAAGVKAISWQGAQTGGGEPCRDQLVEVAERLAVTIARGQQSLQGIAIAQMADFQSALAAPVRSRFALVDNGAI